MGQNCHALFQHIFWHLRKFVNWSFFMALRFPTLVFNCYWRVGEKEIILYSVPICVWLEVSGMATYFRI